MAMNIGMCARAMWNCGIDDMRLVNPRDGWPNPDAIAPATDAKEVVERATLYSSVAEAVADCNQVYAATARLRHLDIPVVTPSEAAEEIHALTKSGGKVGILFGAEASGLDNDDVSRANKIINYPMNPQFTSLNLAQAVLLMSWEWWKLTTSGNHREERVPVSQEQLEFFLARLEGELETRGFFPNADKKPNTVQKMRAMFHRLNPTEQELRTLQGMLTSLTKENR